MVKKYLFKSLGFFGIMTCILFGFLISDLVASDAPISQEGRDKKTDEIVKQVQALTVGVQGVRKESSYYVSSAPSHESSEGYTAPVSFSSEGYSSYADDAKRQQRSDQYK